MESTCDIDTSKILEKGPEYLRKQLEPEAETKAGMSAVERLAASKLKYVKSQHVANSIQEPVISIGSASVSSNGSSNRSGKIITKKNSPGATGNEQSSCSGQDNNVRRTSSKKRPDSILLYRQKCDLRKRSPNERYKKNARRLLLSSVNKKLPLLVVTDTECKPSDNTSNASDPERAENQNAQQSEAIEQEETQNSNPVTHALDEPANKLVDEVKRRNGKGVSRSHSDISSRYSKNFADFDAFFKYCGLDSEVIESMGRDTFSSRSDDKVYVRSVSVSESDDGFSRNSGDSDGLMEEELHENIRQETSVIERNARIIKWLYSCKNAKETGKKLRDLD